MNTLPRPLHKQGDRVDGSQGGDSVNSVTVRHLQRLKIQSVFTVEVESLPACDQQRQPRAVCQQVRQQLRLHQQMLEVIEKEQQLFGTQKFNNCLVNRLAGRSVEFENTLHCVADKRGVAHGCQRNIDNTIRI